MSKKEKYITPESEVISFDTEDVITTSNGTEVLDPFGDDFQVEQ